MRIKIDFKKTAEKMMVIPGILAEKAFLFFVSLLFVNLILSAVVFYWYNFLFFQREQKIEEGQFRVKKDSLEDILKKMEEDKTRFEKADKKEYPDFFETIQSRIERLKNLTQ